MMTTAVQRAFYNSLGILFNNDLAILCDLLVRISTDVDLSKILGGQTKILGGQKLIKDDKCMGVS